MQCAITVLAHHNAVAFDRPRNEPEVAPTMGQPTVMQHQTGLSPPIDQPTGEMQPRSIVPQRGWQQ